MIPIKETHTDSQTRSYTCRHKDTDTGDGIIKMHFHVGNGPIKIIKGKILFKRSLILMKNHKITNENIKHVKFEKLKIKTWFCDKDLSSVNLFSKTHDFIKNINLFSKMYAFRKNNKFVE